jgi:hypothetical protein
MTKGQSIQPRGNQSPDSFVPETRAPFAEGLGLFEFEHFQVL